MSTDPNPYRPSQVTLEEHESPSFPREEEDGELSVILQIVKIVSVAFGGLMFLAMMLWWISALLSRQTQAWELILGSRRI